MLQVICKFLSMLNVLVGRIDSLKQIPQTTFSYRIAVGYTNVLSVCKCCQVDDFHNQHGALHIQGSRNSSIFEFCGKDNRHLQRLIVPEGVTEVGAKAFIELLSLNH